MNARIYRFLVVGGGCYLTNLLLLYFLTSVIGIHYLISAFASFFIVNLAGYYSNKNYTFEKRGDFWIGLKKYNMVMISSCFIVLTLMYILVDIFHVQYLLANILITIAITLYNFFLHQNWTFK